MRWKAGSLPSIDDWTGVDAFALHLAAVASPLWERCRKIIPVVASSAFGAEETGLQQQLTCLLTMVKIKKKIELAAAGFLQLEAAIVLLIAHRLKQRAALQRGVGLEDLPQGLPHPAHVSIDSCCIPAG